MELKGKQEAQELLPPAYSEVQNGKGPPSDNDTANVAKSDLALKGEKDVNFKSDDGITERIPNDKWSVVYLILLIHGIGTLMPWNMFITANSYFVDYKLGSSGNTTIAVNSTDIDDDDASVYRTYFLSALGFVAQVPNLVLNAMNLFCQCGGGGNTVRRVIWSIITVVLMFILTVVLAMVDSSSWKPQFFFITMGSVVIINMATGVYQNSVYGIAACLPMKYTNAVILGSNLSGLLISVLNILSIASAPNPRTAAIYYFIAAIFILLVAFDTYYALPLIPYYRYYSEKSSRNTIDSKVVFQRPPFLDIFKKCYVHLLGVFCVFFVTLSCFPALQADIKPLSDNFIVNDKYFTPITTFLFFSVFAVLGNLTTEFFRRPGPKWVWVPVVMRLAFIPFFLFSNFKPEERTLPVYITNDYVYCAGGILMSYTSGYFSSLCMMYAPRNVEPEHAGSAGMMAAIFLISGIFGGCTFAILLSWISMNL